MSKRQTFYNPRLSNELCNLTYFAPPFFYILIITNGATTIDLEIEIQDQRHCTHARYTNTTIMILMRKRNINTMSDKIDEGRFKYLLTHVQVVHYPSDRP